VSERLLNVEQVEEVRAGGVGGVVQYPGGSAAEVMRCDVPESSAGSAGGDRAVDARN
jgi:hypothetical protein